ncbi:LOW QUALITY PROTEIN: hypothetical protein Cgig2_002365 [Carnegiea gigantea]|uniref:Uncharacterized protein n=1 Tax=Carnegiea gigantea TaxID=171969 RepID=A0A9Q1QH74_9CARY|nr:LOW QUALITY PROTEIN: hypothetical protein Cgig2_002365 [Carnegiea gigantea]
MGGLGLKAMRQTNSAFLTKLGWRVLNEKGKLWSQVVRAKYCDGQCDIDMYLREGVGTEVRNGKRTLFWYHNWVTAQPLCSIATLDIPPQLEDATELWDATLGWKWELFAHCLPEATLKIIASNELQPREENEDQLVWTGLSHGNFSLKSAIAII